jgi:hypothetical protein
MPSIQWDGHQVKVRNFNSGFPEVAPHYLRATDIIDTQLMLLRSVVVLHTVHTIVGPTTWPVGAGETCDRQS